MLLFVLIYIVIYVVLTRLKNDVFYMEIVFLCLVVIRYDGWL